MPANALLADLFADPSVLRELVRSLTCYCLDNRPEIESLLDEVSASQVRFGTLRNAFLDVPMDRWIELEQRGQGFSRVLDAPLVSEGAARLGAVPGLAVLAALRGVARAWEQKVSDYRGELKLIRGDVIPRATRPIHTLFADHTPNPSSLDDAALLADFVIYEPSSATTWDVIVDFSRRDELDAATWIGDTTHGRFPAIATISHERSFATDMRYDVDEQAGVFFFVAPKVFQRDEIIECLANAKDRAASIAVLPELSLPAPEALGAALSAQPKRFPELVVAGSAHAEVTAGNKLLRVNESQTYLNGSPLLTHRKINPLIFRVAAAELREDLNRQPKEVRIAASLHTRLAVAICADLHSEALVTSFRQLGVNLLIVPSMTPHEGGFQSAGLLCGHCQAVVVVANGAPPVAHESDAPFMVSVGVPRTKSSSESFPQPGKDRRAYGLLDVNRDLNHAMEWL